MQSLSYCFYEILDNVHIHSGKPLGTAITHFDATKDVLRVLVADDGMGIRESLAENEKLVLPERMLLMYCGDTPSLLAICEYSKSHLGICRRHGPLWPGCTGFSPRLVFSAKYINGKIIP